MNRKRESYGQPEMRMKQKTWEKGTSKEKTLKPKNPNGEKNEMMPGSAKLKHEESIHLHISVRLNSEKL